VGWLGDLSATVAWFGDPAHWQGPDGIGVRTFEHVWLSVAAVLIACLVAIPIGLWLGHLGKGGVIAVNISNVGRAVPTFAALVLLALAPSPFGLTLTSTLTALVLFALPPVLTNTYVGMREVDRGAVDAALGMGMNGWQLLRRVELPLATPLIMTGIRLAAVQVVATATIAALVAGPGLGAIIVNGYGRQDLPQLLAGAILVAVLALLVEALMAGLERLVTPARRRRPQVAGDAVLAATGVTSLEGNGPS
jgi:osmoprotectant transport system permease protein